MDKYLMHNVESAIPIERTRKLKFFEKKLPKENTADVSFG